MVEDVTILSASQMIQLSGDRNSNSLLNTFTCGRHRDGHHICLNMELDSIKVASEDLLVTVDIDSLVWVTRCHAPNRFGTVNMEDNVNIKRS